MAAPCRDGYCTALWHAASCRLSVELVVASQAAARLAGRAAQQVFRKLLEQHPGSRLAVSSGMQRLA